MNYYRKYRCFGWAFVIGCVLFMTGGLQAGSLLPGDANADGAVGLLDLDILGNNFGVDSGAVSSDGDFNGDGAVGLIDLDVLGKNFGRTADPVLSDVPAGQNLPIVPLPSSVLAGLVMLGTLGTVHVVRHRRRSAFK